MNKYAKVSVFFGVVAIILGTYFLFNPPVGMEWAPLPLIIPQLSMAALAEYRTRYPRNA